MEIEGVHNHSGKRWQADPACAETCKREVDRRSRHVPRRLRHRKRFQRNAESCKSNSESLLRRVTRRSRSASGSSSPAAEIYGCHAYPPSNAARLNLRDSRGSLGPLFLLAINPALPYSSRNVVFGTGTVRPRNCNLGTRS